MAFPPPVSEDLHRLGVFHEAQFLGFAEGRVDGAQQLLGLVALLPQSQNLAHVLLAEPSLSPVQSLQCATQILLQELVHPLVLQTHLLFELTHPVLQGDRQTDTVHSHFSSPYATPCKM